MTIHIPAWLLWALGGAAVACLLTAATYAALWWYWSRRLTRDLAASIPR